MFPGRVHAASGLKIVLLAGLAIASVGAASSVAMAEHDRGRGGCRGGYDRGGGDRTRVNLSINVGSGYRSGFRGYDRCDSGWGGSSWPGSSWGGSSFGYSSYNRRGSSFGYSYSSGWCPPPVVIAPCPPRVVYVPGPVYVQRPVYVERPVYIERPVYVEPVRIERQVLVEKPVYIERPVVVERAATVVQTRVVVERPAQVITDDAQGRYQDRELGDAYLRSADFDNASRVYRRYLQAWNGDGTAARNLGLSLIGRGDVQEGFRTFVDGYAAEPNLYNRPVRVVDVGGAFGFQRLLDAASRGADGTNTPQGWFTVAILQNLAGNREAATQASQRARDAGLDSATLDKLTLLISRQTS